MVPARASYRVGLATTRSRQHRCRGALRRALSPTFRLEFLSLGAGVPTNPARRSFCSTCSGRLMARSPPGADVDFFLAISVCCGDRAGWGDGAGAARGTGSDWRRPDRDSTAVGALRRSLSPTFRLEFLSLGAGVPTNPARRSFCSTCSGRLMARSPPGADVDFFLAISVCCGDRAGGVMVPARREVRGRIGDDPIATAPL